MSASNVLNPHNDYTTVHKVERLGPDGKYIGATGLTNLRAFIALTAEATGPVHPTLDIQLVETSTALYQGTYDGGDIATAFPEVTASNSVEAWEILQSSSDLRVVRKLKVKLLRVSR